MKKSISIAVAPTAIPQASPTTLRNTEHSQESSSRATRNQRRGGSGRPGAFVIAEDTVADSQPTQTTESSALSERNPNSQTERRSSTNSSKHIEIHSSEVSTQNSSSLVFLNTSDLPITLDSRPPPQAPPRVHDVSVTASTDERLSETFAWSGNPGQFWKDVNEGAIASNARQLSG